MLPPIESKPVDKLRDFTLLGICEEETPLQLHGYT